MHSGPEQLRDWMERRGFKVQADAARFLGLELSVFSLLVNGKRKPGVDYALRIEKSTGIPVEAWATDDDDSDQPMAAMAGKRNVHR